VTLDHVRSTLALMFCAATVLVGQTPTPLSAPLSTHVTAVVMPDGRYSRVAVGEMGREAASILKKSGVTLSWDLQQPAREVNGLLVVVKLIGSCDMDAPQAPPKPGPLGWSHEVNGVVLPFSDLACDNIRGSVQNARLAGSQVRGNFLLGRAMGRVLAHELYHIVADTAGHGENGVAQPALSARELTSGQLELGPSDVEAIQSGLREAR
jgi:hypothetical protein